MATKKRTFLGKEFKLTFYDHVMCGDKLGVCEIWGRCVGETKEALNIAVWDLPYDKEETRYHNQERFTIIKSAIIKIKEIK